MEVHLKQSLKLFWERVVDRAEVEPRGGDDLRLRACALRSRSLGEDDRQASFQVPVDVAAERSLSGCHDSGIGAGTHQWRNHGPGLSARKRMTTPPFSTATTSRRGLLFRHQRRK